MRIIRRPLITVLGGVLMLAGLIMLITPGPGLVTIAAGVALLATEYTWARRLSARVKRLIKSTAQKA